MKTAKTQLDEKQIEQIEQTGMSVYQFLQEAVDLKLRNIQVSNMEATITGLMSRQKLEIDKMHKAALEEYEERFLKIVGYSTTLVKESLEREELMKEKMNSAFSKILELLKSKGA